MKTTRLQWLGITILLITGLIHLFLAPQEFEEVPHMGYLFGINFLAALTASIGVYRQKTWGWGLGFLVALGSISGYLLTRTVGMPGHEVEEWFSPIGVLSLSLEAVLLVLAILVLAGKDQQGYGKKYLVVVPTACLLVTALAGGVNLYHNQHVELLSLNALEEEYGVRVSAIGMTMDGSIVDLRLQIVDAEKAEHLLGHSHKSMLLMTEDRTIELSGAHLGHHQTIRNGSMDYIWFANHEYLIQPGMAVLLQIDHIQVGSIIVQ